jgi:hypothetical protein
MIAVNIHNIKDGMIPAKDITDQSGRLILASGNEITRRHIKIFQAWGITEVTIQEGKAEPFNDTEALEVPEQVQNEVNELFQHMDHNHPAVSELMELCRMRKVGALEGHSNEA